ncbi:hypothetical protein GWI33_007248 [Rhynchophorus ferrugineus]|uniref:Uncharacterized protein n=1 Tax=Rhynchophorus ferrugineus TaxID=354439 RepID=A0A834IKK7_RHYFE|nr:hypothetical protein GWI33_007248 [Rhynchophorus ferrugineus]
MNAELLQHHFDQVFTVLQDRENFEIFTKIKQCRSPRIQKTFFKIIDESDVACPSGKSTISALTRNPRRQISLSTLNPSPYNSRPSSASVVKARGIFRPHSRPATPSSDSSGEVGDNCLGQCKQCGRYFLGNYLTIHEEKCEHY